MTILNSFYTDLTVSDEMSDLLLLQKTYEYYEKEKIKYCFLENAIDYQIINGHVEIESQQINNVLNESTIDFIEECSEIEYNWLDPKRIEICM